MDASLPVLCGLVSTGIFVLGTLPMLVKAARTRDLSSYSLGNIVMSNVGNAINSVYVLSLPPGPIWALHGFNVVATGLMLVWYLRYTHRRTQKSPWPDPTALDSSPDAATLAAFVASKTPADAGELVGSRGG